MAWSSLLTYIWIFPVGRGNAAFLRSGLNQGFILDIGGGELCDPADFIRDEFLPHIDKYKTKNIAQAVLSHPHADHISQCGDLGNGQELYPSLLTCPHDKDPEEAVDFERIDPDGRSDLLETYRSLFEERRLPLQTILFDSARTVPNLEYGVYYVRPSACDGLHEDDDNKYGNSLSIVFYYRHGTHTVLFPGDITPEALKLILDDGEHVEKRYTIFDRAGAENHPHWHDETSDQPDLGGVLRDRGLSILVAPHHGLESCYSDDLYHAIAGDKPDLVVISERRKKKDKDGHGKVDGRYQSEDGAKGLAVDIEGRAEKRYSVTTKDGHHILIVFAGTGAPRIFADRDPEALLKKLT